MSRLLKWSMISVCTVIVIVVALAAFNWERIERLMRVNTLFDEGRIVANFSAMDTMFESAPMDLGDVAASPLPLEPRDLPRTFTHRGRTIALADWLEENGVTALVVVQDGAIAFEDYYRGTGPDDLRISWSVAKSFLSILLGTAVDRGEIASLDDPVTDYAPGLRGSAYEGVTIRQVANMASGVTFDEDYLDYDSDINRMGRVLALGGSMDAFAAGLTERDRAPGEAWQYVSIDTHVLGMVIRGATGRSIPDLMVERVMIPLGLEADPYYVADGFGTAFVLGGLNLTTRDYARFGLMVEQGGRIGAARIISRSWIEESTGISAPLPHDDSQTEAEGTTRYGYQWWIPPEPRPGEVYAVGVYDQFVYVSRSTGTVIAMNAGNRRFREPGVRAGHIAMFRAIADHLTAF
ncbi:MAG: serine hydrolase domain-containing protein [Rubricella sp.]